MTTSGWLHIASCIYLGLVVTLILGVIEFDQWNAIWRSTLRRWLQLMGALVLLAVVVQTCTFVAQKNANGAKKSLTSTQVENRAIESKHNPAIKRGKCKHEA